MSSRIVSRFQILVACRYCTAAPEMIDFTGMTRADLSVRLDKMGNMHMLSKSVGIVAVMIFAWQSVGQADAACQTINGALCGGGGNGSISSVSGNVSLAQGVGILRASSGSSISPGARILAETAASLK